MSRNNPNANAWSKKLSFPSSSGPNGQKEENKPPITTRVQPPSTMNKPAVHFGTVEKKKENNQSNDLKKSAPAPDTSNKSWASVITKTTPVSIGGGAPKDIQNNVQPAEPANTQSNGKLKFGSFNQEEEKLEAEKPKEIVQPQPRVAGLKNASAAVFQDIQRVRSAPPELAPDQQQQHQKIRHQPTQPSLEGSNSSDQNSNVSFSKKNIPPPQPTMPMFPPALNPAANSFAPGSFGFQHYPVFVMTPHGYPLASSHPPHYANYPAPNMIQSGMPFPAQQSSQQPTTTSTFSKKPPVTPSPQMPKKDDSSKPLVQPPQPRVVINITDPKTGEKVVFSKSKETSRSQSITSLNKEAIEPENKTDFKKSDSESEKSKELQVLENNEIKEKNEVANVEKNIEDKLVQLETGKSDEKEEIKEKPKSLEEKQKVNETKPIEKSKEKDNLPKQKVEVKKEQVAKVSEKPKEEKLPSNSLVEDSIKKDALNGEIEREELKENEKESNTEKQEKIAAPPGFDSQPLNSEIKKSVYSIDFLLTFKDKFKQPPADLQPMEALIGQEATTNAPSYPTSTSGGRKGSKRQSDVGLSSRPPSNSGGRYSEYGTYKQRSTRGSSQKPPSGSSGGRQSMGGRRQSSYMGKKHFKEEEPQPELEKSDSRWVPASVFKDSKTVDEEEALARQSRSFLNKLTVEKFESISAKMLQMDLDSFEKLQILLDSIFEKAISEPKFCPMYSKLCLKFCLELNEFSEEKINELKKQVPNLPAKKAIFRKFLLTKCQQEFEKKNDWANAEPFTITDDMTEEQMAAVAAEENKRRLLKRRTLGNIRFVGELFKDGMLSEKIMHDCLKLLLRNVDNPEEEELESVCDLMNTIGEKLDKKEAANYMNSYIERLTILSKNNKVNSRIRFKIMDVLDLRKNNWKLKGQQKLLQSGPMSIDEVHRLAEEKIRLEQQKANKPLPRKEVKRAPQPTAIYKKPQSQQNEWSDVKKKSVKKEEEEKLSRNSSASEINSANKNIFDLLNTEDSPKLESKEIAEVNDEEGLETEKEKNTVLKKSKEEIDEYLNKELISKFIESSEKSEEAAFEVVEQFMSFVEKEDEADRIKALLDKLLNDLTKYILVTNPKPSVIKAVAFTFNKIFELERWISSDKMREYVEENVVLVPDKCFDVPGFDLVMGTICVPLLKNQYFSFKENLIKSILRYAAEFYDFTPKFYKGMKKLPAYPNYAEMFATLLKIANQESDNEKLILDEIFEKESKRDIDVSDFLYPFLGTDTEKLELLPDIYITTLLEKFDLLKTFPATQLVHVFLQKIQYDPLQSFNIELNDSLAKIVIDELSKISSKKPSLPWFLRALLEIIIKISFTTISSDLKQEERLKKEKENFSFWLSKVFSVFAKSLSEKAQNELLLSVEKLGNQGQFKKDDDFFKKVFQELFDQNLISKNAFKNWLNNRDKDLKPKESTLKRGAQEFLDSISVE